MTRSTNANIQKVDDLVNKTYEIITATFFAQKKKLIRPLLLSFIKEFSKRRKYLKFKTNYCIFLETYYYFLYRVFKKSNDNFIFN